jgi:hypothetical protein
LSTAQEPEEKPVEIDFRRRETEAGWQRILDRLGLRAAPVWFEWLEWILVLGALHYIGEKSGSPLVRLIPGISVGLLWFYLNGFFFRMKFKGVVPGAPGSSLSGVALLLLLLLIRATFEFLLPILVGIIAIVYLFTAKIPQSPLNK